MRINYNVSSLIAKNALNNNDKRLSVSIKKLSSGYKINSSKENAASLAIARKMNAQISSLNRANQNANDGISVVNTADGAMGEMHAILQRMNELAVQSANGPNSDSDRLMIQKEIDQLVAEIDRIADTTQFNAQNLIDGSFAYRGYTNSENVRLKSYSDGVVSGTYVMDQLVYYYYEEETIYKNSNIETERNKRFAVDSIDDIKDWLVTQAEVDDPATVYADIISGIKGFPNDAKIEIDGEDIIITAPGDFEVKITMNTRDPFDRDTATTITETTTVTTNHYRNVFVYMPDGTECRIDDISVSEEVGVTTTTVSVYVGNGNESFNSLKESFADYFNSNTTVFPNGVDSVSDITSITYDGTTNSFTMVVTVDDGTGTLKTERVTMKAAGTSLDGALYSTTTATKTKYTVAGGDEMLQFNLTGKGPMRIQVGPSEGQVIAIEIPALNAIYLGVDGLDVTTEDKATEAINIVAKAINQLSSVRAKIGAYSNRLEHTITNLDTTEENMTAAYSRIMDVDIAKETTEYSTMQVLVQAATAMLAQANERPQQVLQLIQ